MIESVGHAALQLVGLGIVLGAVEWCYPNRSEHKPPAKPAPAPSAAPQQAPPAQQQQAPAKPAEDPRYFNATKAPGFMY